MEGGEGTKEGRGNVEEGWRDGRMEGRHGRGREPWGGGGTQQSAWAFYEVKSVWSDADTPRVGLDTGDTLPVVKPRSGSGASNLVGMRRVINFD